MKSSELLRILQRDGWFTVRQAGSHVIMQHHSKTNTIPVPFHVLKEMKKGTLQKILKLAEIETNKR